METPKPIYIQTPNKEQGKNFNILFEEKNYNLEINSTEKQIYISLTQKEGITYSYEGIFSLEEMKNINNIFNFFNSISSIRNSVESIIQKNKYELKRINTNKISIILKVEFFENIVDVSIPLNQKKKNQEEIINDLIEQNNILKTELNSIKEEEISLKNSIKSLEKDNEEIKSKLEIIENKIKVLENNKTVEPKKINISSSVIVTTSEQNNFIINRLKEVPQFKNKNFYFNLLYKGTRDGDKSRTFHNLCDNKNNIIVFVETTKNRKFGGFCSVGYKSEGGYQKDDTAFIFSLDKLKYYNVKKGGDAIYCDINYGPLFDGSVGVVENEFFSRINYSSYKSQYYETTIDFELNGGEDTYHIKEVEVFQITIQ